LGDLYDVGKTTSETEQAMMAYLGPDDDDDDIIIIFFPHSGFHIFIYLGNNSGEKKRQL
jgi:hypothetical protein